MVALSGMQRCVWFLSCAVVAWCLLLGSCKNIPLNNAYCCLYEIHIGSPGRCLLQRRLERVSSVVEDGLSIDELLVHFNDATGRVLLQCYDDVFFLAEVFQTARPDGAFCGSA